MQRVIVWGIVVGLIGLLVGYVVFGRIAGEYVGFFRIMSPPANWVDEIGETLTGIGEVRQRILTSGFTGMVLGAIVSAVLMRK